MAELKLGNKFECFRCGTKFYDLGKSQPVCPKCGADQRDAAESQLVAAAAQAARRKRKAEVVRAPVEEEETVEVEPVVDEEIEVAALDADVEQEEAEEAEDEA